MQVHSNALFPVRMQSNNVQVWNMQCRLMTTARKASTPAVSPTSSTTTYVQFLASQLLSIASGKMDVPFKATI